MTHWLARTPSRHLVATVVLGVALMGTSPAVAAPTTTPTLKVSSTVAGHPTPVAFFTGEWTLEDGVWILPLRSVSLPGGVTTVTATWRSPIFRATPSNAVFSSNVQIAHQGVAGNEAMKQSFRFCESVSRCSRWEGVGSDGVPDSIDPESAPYRITTSNGLSLGWRRSPSKIWVEWRYTHTQKDASYAESTVRLGIGSAAARVP